MFHVEQIILRRKFLKLHKIKKPEQGMSGSLG